MSLELMMNNSDTTMRLQKFLAASGLGSRRSCEKIIADGRVEVNGKIANELGTKVNINDKVVVDGKIVKIHDKNIFL